MMKITIAREKISLQFIIHVQIEYRFEYALTLLYDFRSEHTLKIERNQGPIFPTTWYEPSAFREKRNNQK